MLVREAPDSRGVPDRVRRGAGGCGSAFVQCGERHGGIGRGGSLPEIRAAAQEKREATHRLVPERGNWVNRWSVATSMGDLAAQPLRCWPPHVLQHHVPAE